MGIVEAGLSDIGKFGKSFIGPGLEELGLAKFGWSDGVEGDFNKSSLVIPRGAVHTYTLANGITGYYFLSPLPLMNEGTDTSNSGVIIISDVASLSQDTVSEDLSFGSEFRNLNYFATSHERVTLRMEVLLGHSYEETEKGKSSYGSIGKASNTIKEYEKKIKEWYDKYTIPNQIENTNNKLYIGSLLTGTAKRLILYAYEVTGINKEYHIMNIRISGYTINDEAAENKYNEIKDKEEYFKKQTKPEDKSTGSALMGMLTGGIDKAVSSIGSAIPGLG